MVTGRVIVHLMRGDLYARKSTADAGRSVARQESDWRADCAAEGIEPGRIFVDPDLSASRYARKERPEYAELVSHIRAGNCEMVCLWEASRGSRNLAEWVAFLELCRASGVLIRVFSDGGRTYDVRKRRDYTDLAKEGVDAHDESAQLSDRVLSGTRHAASVGKPPGPLLYGYTRTYDERRRFVQQVIRPDEAAIVRRTVDDTLAGIPLHTQARRLNAEGIAGPSGKAGSWVGAHINRMLRNPGYVGDRVYHGEVVARDAWEGILTRDEQRRIRAMLETPGRRPHADSSLKYLLSGAATCGACGEPLRVRRQSSNYNCVAVGCQRVSARRLLMDAEVTEIVHERLRRRDSAALFAPEVDDEAIAAMKREIRDLTEHLDGFYAQAAMRKLSAEGLARVEAQIRPQIDAAEEKLRRLSTPPALAALEGVDVLKVWPDLPVGLQRAVILHVADIVLSPCGKGARWSPDRLAASRWRGDDLTWGERWAS